jgi:hypothetical protein
VGASTAHKVCRSIYPNAKKNGETHKSNFLIKNGGHVRRHLKTSIKGWKLLKRILAGRGKKIWWRSWTFRITRNGTRKHWSHASNAEGRSCLIGLRFMREVANLELNVRSSQLIPLMVDWSNLTFNRSSNWKMYSKGRSYNTLQMKSQKLMIWHANIAGVMYPLVNCLNMNLCALIAKHRQ